MHHALSNSEQKSIIKKVQLNILYLASIKQKLELYLDLYYYLILFTFNIFVKFLTEVLKDSYYTAKGRRNAAIFFGEGGGTGIGDGIGEEEFRMIGERLGGGELEGIEEGIPGKDIGERGKGPDSPAQDPVTTNSSNNEIRASAEDPAVDNPDLQINQTADDPWETLAKARTYTIYIRA